MALPNPVAAFLEAAAVPLHGHNSGSLDLAEEILSAHPEVAMADIYSASVLGDADTIRDFLAVDPSLATAKGGPRDWDALTYLCFSQYLRSDRSRWDVFLEAAHVLLDAGADANTGFLDATHTPEPILESVIYAAAAVARHPGLTQLLLERGADPNDEETPYHVPEAYDNTVLEIILASGKLNADSLAMALFRKADWHDGAGMKLLLAAGADPNRMTRWHHTALHQAVRRDNDIALIDLLLDHGADPLLPSRLDGKSALHIAACRGRKDVMESAEKRGFPVQFEGAMTLVAACARGHGDAARELTAGQPEWRTLMLKQGGALLAQFAGTGNAEGVRCLLDLGVDVHARYGGDGYYDIAPASTALHVAAWRARHQVVRVLLDRGASVELPDGAGRTPLMLAVKACTDSYWVNRRRPDSVKMLLEAGASTEGIALPTGYDEIDALLIS